MTPDAVDRIRTHRRTLAARWAGQIANLPHSSLVWRDAARLDRHLVAGMDALVDAAQSGGAEPFTEFAGRFSQEMFAGQVPLDEVIRALLQIKPVVLDYLAERGPAGGLTVEAVQFLNNLLSIGVLEAIRRHERQRDRRSLATQEQIDELRDRLRRQVLVEPASGLYNANYFALAVRRELVRSRRFGRTFTLGLVALDQDDEIREMVGEEGLRAVSTHLAGSLTRTTREVDFRAALGGGRFGLILPETPLEGAFVVAERLRRAVESSTFSLPDHPFP
ncbi:MAG: diguanylate cyclase, partial [Armatimonadota bacterium]|nr:diguanylate cyclase [Armatimonadota bacterium]